MKIILQAKDVPNNQTVTKPTGEKQFTLVRNGLTLYTNSQKILLLSGTVFLLNGPNINVVNENMEVAVHFKTLADCYEWLGRREKR